MGVLTWRRWLRSLVQPPIPTVRRKRSALVLERLEDRTVPATFVWDGGGADANWKTAGNWVGDEAPSGTAVALDDLVFPTASVTNTNNDFADGVFNSITFSGSSSYTLAGNALTLGDASALGSGNLIVNASASGQTQTISLDLQLGGAGGRQSFTIANGGKLVVSGELSGNANVELTKFGTGRLVLAGDNSAFDGPITVDSNAGILEVNHENALGGTGQGTTIGTNAQLQINMTGAAADFGEDLVVNGTGLTSDGVLKNVAGDSTWSGAIRLDSNIVVGVNSGTSLDIAGQISDLGFGYNLVKEGTGTLILSAANTYRGSTTINDGILEIQHALALGTADGDEASGTLVNRNNQKVGTLRLNRPSGIGFTVAGELLTLNGPGSGNIGALYSAAGNNTWSGNIHLGSPSSLGSDATIGVEDGFSLTISGLIDDTNAVRPLVKIDTGTLILTRNNMDFDGAVVVQAGILNIRDSGALGSRTVGTTVQNGATLELEVDNQPDSATGTTNQLLLTEPLTIQGLGVGGEGALVSRSGINVYEADITVSGSDTGIGVLLDPNPTNDTNYFINDFSLTITGDLIGGGSNAISKLGTGHLILPEANNRFSGPFNILAGWVTVHNNNSLGQTLAGSQSNQSTVTVAPGAALHLYPLTGNLTLPYNFILAGSGFDHTFDLINQQGAIENLNGINTIPGNITLRGQVGIGVEHVFGPSQLYLTGLVTEATPIINVSGNASGGPEEDINVIDTGSTSGTITVTPQVFSIPDDVRIYLGDYENDRSNAILVYDSTTNGDPSDPTNQFRATITVVYDTTTATASAVHLPKNSGRTSPFNGDGAGYQLGPVVTNYTGLTSTAISIVVNEGGSTQNITQWNYTASIVPSGVFGGGISKLGSKLLVMQNDGTYTGDNDIRAGVILVQNYTALGHDAGKTIVHPGTALLLANGDTSDGQFGLHIWGEHLKLSGPGNTTLGATLSATAGPPLAPLTILEDATVPNLVGANDVIVLSEHLWRGKVSLDTSVAIDIPQDTRLTILGAMDDTANTSGSDLVKIGAGELILGGANTYRGTTYVGTSAAINPDVGGVPVNDFFDNNNPQPLPGGIVTVAHSQALGTAGNAEVQTVTVTSSTAGTFTLDFRGHMTDALPVDATPAAVASALNDLPSIRDVGGSVSVTKTGATYTITFGGSLVGANQEQIDAEGSSGVNASEATVTQGRGGTVVQNGAALQLQGNLTVAGESLIIEGTGVATPPAAPVPTWFSIGPDGSGVSASQVNSVGIVTGNPLIAFAGLGANGAAQFTNDLAWTATGTGIAGLVRVDPNDANYVYQVLGGNLFRSTTGGAPGSYTSIIAASHFSIDATNTQRLAVVGGGSLRESLDQGNSWTTLLSTSATLVAAAGFQGTFEFDSGFPQVADLVGANQHDVNTFYFATSSTISVTKNAKTAGPGGPTVVQRNLPGGLDSISDLFVDPRDRDTVYVTRSTQDTLGRKVYKSVDAGRNWISITGNLPDTAVWKFLLDVRNDTLYVATDQGVYRSSNGGTTWQTFGSGLPSVSVRDVVLDPTLNTLTVATQSRGVYQIWLNDPQPDAGVLRVISGSNVWTGPVLLRGDAVVNVQGTQTLQDGISQAKLNIIGTVNDVDAGDNARLTKIGGGDLILSGANTYGGVTDILDGVVVVNNPRALGSAVGETIVTAGTALELQSDLQAELIILHGHGASTLDDHNTGALRNISNNNTFTGTLQFNSNTTIGVDSGSSLTIGSKTGLTGTGTITDDGDNFGFVKELKGKLALGSANTYAGATRVEQGILNIQDDDALGSGGSAASGTTVVDGAQLQIEGDITVASELLRVSGTGISGTGVVQNVDGDNHWQGTVTFAQDAAFSPVSTPPVNIAIGALSSGANDQLTIDGAIEQVLPGQPLGLSKTGAGRVVLNNDNNSYEGLTTVFEGALRIQQGGALGQSASGTSVRAGAALELDGAAADFTVADEALSLNGTGIAPANAGVLRNISGSNTWTGTVTLQASIKIEVEASSQLLISGTVRDTSPAAADPAADVTKTGAGVLVFAGANTYNGGTFVNQGIVNIRHEDALGAPLVSEEQRVTLTGPSTGSFRLTFTTPGTPPQSQSTPFRPATWTASQLQSDLENLSNIGTGNVSVTKAGSTFVITFQGALANADQLELTGTGQGGTGVSIVTSREGSRGTTVANGATLQVQGGITVATERLTLNGNGVNNRGALENVSGDNIWQNTVTLASNASIGVDGESETLTIVGGIVQTGGSRGVTKVGPGTLDYAGGAANTYTGLTQVNEGTLQLSKSSGTAVAGNMTIGDGITGNATARWESSDQVINSAAVIVNNDGTLDLNSQTEQVGPLTVSAGQVTVTTGALAITTLNMTGGGVDLVDALGSLILGGNVTATSNAGVAATIEGLGTLDLNNAARDFTVSTGGEMIIDVPLSDNSLDALVKRGAGLLVIDVNSIFDNQSTIKTGILQVDGSIGNIAIDGGTLEGHGTVGIISTTVSGVALGPGSSVGSLNSGNADLDPSDTFFVELNNTTPGTGYDQLFVTGTIKLDGAKLGGTVGSGVVAGNSFTIITASVAVQGQFQQGTIAFIGGKKFDVDYNATTVVLNRIKAEATTTLVSSDNSTNFGQAFTVTATVTPESGAGAPAATDTVTFSIVNTATNVVHASQTIALTILGNGTGQATFDPQSLLGSALGAGTYEVRATYNGGADFNPSTATPITQTIDKSNSTTTLASSANPAVYGQTVTIEATVATTVTAGPGYTAAAPSGVVTFSMNGVEIGTGNLNSSGKASITFPTSGVFDRLDVRQHTFSAAYEAGDTNYNPSATTSGLTQTVNRATTTITVSAPSTTTIFGDPLDFTAQVSIVSPGSAVLSGVVEFIDVFQGQTRVLGSAPLSGSGQAVLEDLVLEVGSHSITVSFAGDDNLTSSTFTFTHTIAQRDTTTNLTSNFASNNSDYGQRVTFTATIVPAGGITPVNVTGSADFFIDNILVGDDVTVNPNTGKATFTTSSVLGPGQHEIKAHYNSDSNYNDSEDTLNHFVQGTTSISLASTSPSVFGQTVTFTATVSATSPSVAAPTGTVELFDGLTLLGTRTITALNPMATFTISNLNVASHNIRAVYHGDTNNSGSETTRVHVVNKSDTRTTVVSSNYNTVYGEPVTFTAEVTAFNGGGGTPTGTVTFVIGTGINTRTFSNVALSGGQAQITLADLVALPTGSTHPVVVTYGGTANYNASLPGSLNPQQTVNKASTTLDLTTTNDDAVYGEPVIKATVTADSPSTATPTGTVRFMVNSTPHDVSLVSGVATLHTLPVGDYTITAEYLGSDNFNVSNQDTQQQSIAEASTTIDLTSTNQDAVYGEPVIKAKVTATSPSTAIPDGTVRITVDDGSTVVTHDLTLANGEVTLPDPPSLDVGNYTITAEYLGTLNFFPSDPDDSLTQIIAAAETTTTLTSSDFTAFLGQEITFSVDVTANGPANGTPTGSIAFVISNGTATDTQTRTLVNGEAEIDLSEFTGLTVTAGTYTVTATYNPNTLNFETSEDELDNQQVRSVPAVTTIVQAPVTTGLAFGLRMEFRDPNTGDLDVDFDDVVTLSLPSSNGPAGGSLTDHDGNPVTLNATDGVAYFTTLIVDRAGTYALRADVHGLNPIAVPSFVAGANRLQPTFTNPVVAGSLFPFGFTFSALDATGNVAENFNTLPTLTLLSGPAGAVLTGGTASVVNGTGSFSGWRVNVPSLSAPTAPYVLRLAAGSLVTLITFHTVAPEGRFVDLTTTTPNSAGAPSFRFLAGPPTPAQQADLGQLREDYGFRFAGTYYFNSANMNEKWFVSRAATLTWYIIKPDGTLHRWNGGSSFTQIDAHPATVGVLDPVNPIVWDDPNLLFVAPMGLSAAEQADLSQLRGDNGFYFSSSYYQNSAGLGYNEKWFRSRSATPTWYIVRPDGRLYRWDGSGSQASDYIQIDAHPATGALDPVSPLVWDDPNLLLQAPLTLAADEQAIVSALREDYGFYFAGNYYQNSSGRNEKWFRDRSADPTWYILEGDGDLFKWDGSGNLNTDFTQIDVDPATPAIDRVDPRVWDDPDLLFRAPLTNITEDPLGELSSLSLANGFKFGGSYYLNFRGENEKWFVNSSNQWFYIKTDGTIHRGDGSLFDTVDRLVWDDPNLLFRARLSIATQGQLRQLRLEHGFYFTGSFAQNYLGLNEKWFRDRYNQWYVITSDGRISRWNAGTSLTFVTTVDTAVWTDPHLLLLS